MRMRLNFRTVFILVLLASCSGNRKTSPMNTIPVIEKTSEISNFIDKEVTLKGIVANSKIPTLLGVDVESDSPDLRGQSACATGILRKWLVTEEEVNNSVANRGAGTFYRLEDPETGRTVQVQKCK